jgi:hypothetical protein
LSFFDETDEPPPTRRVRRPAGSGRRPPSEQQAILIRRAVAGVAILVVVIILAVGVHSCQVSSRNSALRNYTTSVNSLIQRSDGTGNQLFGDLLSAPKSASDVSSLQQELFNSSQSASQELEQGKSLSAPSQVSSAQQNLVVALSLRHSGISDIADRIQQALAKSTATDAINSIATDMQEFLASDVVYTTQTAPQIAAALHAANIAVGQNGESIQATSFLPDLGWLQPDFIAKELGTSLPSSSSSVSGTCPTGETCGDELNSVSVNGVPLSTGGGNTVAASPAPTFTANFTNSGTVAEPDVTVQISVTTSSGTTITAQSPGRNAQPGQSYNVQISLPKVPATGSAQVTVTVEKVAGETNLANNTLQFPVTFD